MKWFTWIRRLILIGTLAALAGIGFVLYYMEYVLDDIDELNNVQLQVPLKIFTKDKKLIATFGEKRRIPVPFQDIPKPLIQAVLATEDQRYFQHSGVDAQGLARALMQLILTGKKVQGGSTITMQVARGFYLSPEKTYLRKIREILLAIKIEHKLSKERILELYLNKVFLGNRAYGVAAAAEIYYGKSLNELSIDQYAMIAGIPKAPSQLNPLANPDAAKKRRNHVLDRLYELGYINHKTYTQAIQAPLNASYHDLRTEIKAPYVAELARTQLQQMYGDSIYTDGFNAYTTVDSHLQNDADVAVQKDLLAYDQRHGYRGSIANWGEPDISHVDEWQARLSKIPAIGGLEPAVVFEMTDRSISVLKSDGDFAIIPWENLIWARKQINANYLGARPKSPSSIVKLGDLIRIRKINRGYQLAQIPKAQAGLIALDPHDGSIQAMVGGFDYQLSKFNRITSANRQPGSSFKPFIFSAALDKGFTLATVINDAPISIYNASDNSYWRPQNDEKKFFGPTRLRDAMVHSRNLVSIRLLDLIGVRYAIQYLERFGFSKEQIPPNLTIALGTASVTPMQMAQGFSVFASGGFKTVPYLIDHVEKNNKTHDVIYQAKPLTACYLCTNTQEAHAPQVITPENAFLIHSVLKDVIDRGTGHLAKELNRHDLAGKTGTTQNQVDAWFAGYNADLVAVTWVGFDTAQQSLHEHGAQAALPMWIDFMRSALAGKKEHTLEQPPGVVSLKIDPGTGKRVHDSNPFAISELFSKSSEEDKEVPETEIDNKAKDSDSSHLEIY